MAFKSLAERIGHYQEQNRLHPPTGRTVQVVVERRLSEESCVADPPVKLTEAQARTTLRKAKAEFGYERLGFLRSSTLLTIIIYPER